MYCLNPHCSKPQNPENSVFCQHCGQRARLGDRYIAYQPLSQGGSSRTFLGLDLQKIVSPRCIIKQFFNAGNEEAFRQQAARLSELGQHPQIPDLYAYFEREQQFLVQEFVVGRSLLQQLQEEGTFDEAQIRDVLAQVLPLLDFLHQHQVIHRDIKPANLIQRRSSSPPSETGQNPPLIALVDFGAMKYATESSLAQTGTLIGSAEYAAPEQLLGKATFASDLYSLGVTCLHLLTGLRPFDLFDSVAGVWRWQSVVVGVSQDLIAILERLTALDLSDRYSKASDVLHDLGLPRPKPSPPAPMTSIPRQRWECVTTIATTTEVNTLAATPDGRLFLSGDNDGLVKLWDCERGEELWSLTGHEHIITSVAVSPDGRFIVSGSLDYAVNLWDLKTAKLLMTLFGHQDGVTRVAITPDSKTLVSSSRDKTIRLWNLQTGQLRGCLVGHQSSVEAIALDDHGQLLASGDAGGAVKIWHLGTQELLRTLSGHAAKVSAVALTADAQTVISGSWDMALKLRDANAGGVKHNLTGHRLPITAIALSPDGQTVATASHDHTLRIWDLHSGQCLSTLEGHTAGVEAVVFLPHLGLVSGGRDRSIRLWRRVEHQD